MVETKQSQLMDPYDTNCLMREVFKTQKVIDTHWQMAKLLCNATFDLENFYLECIIKLPAVMVHCG